MGIRENMYSGMNFSLSIRTEKTEEEIPCKSVRAFSRETEYETIREGGLNDRVHVRRKPMTKPGTFQIDRYVGEKYRDLFPLGAALVGNIILKTSTRPGVFDQPEATFEFRGCVVTGKSYSDADAEKSSLIMETTTIAYEELTVDWKGECNA